MWKKPENILKMRMWKRMQNYMEKGKIKQGIQQT